MTQPQTPQSVSWQQDVVGLNRELTEIKIAVQRIESTMVPRAEIESDLGRRLAVDTYLADKQGILERLVRLEGGPTRGLAWVGAATGCLGLMLTAIAVTFTIVAWAIVNLHK